MGKYDTILFGESGTENLSSNRNTTGILFETQPAEVPAGEVVSETQENTEDPLAGLPQQEASKDYKSYWATMVFLVITVTTLLTATFLTNEWKLMILTFAEKSNKSGSKDNIKYIDRLPEGKKSNEAAHEETNQRCA